MTYTAMTLRDGAEVLAVYTPDEGEPLDGLFQFGERASGGVVTRNTTGDMRAAMLAHDWLLDEGCEVRLPRSLQRAFGLAAA